jgi:hypothetical protein
MASWWFVRRSALFVAVFLTALALSAAADQRVASKKTDAALKQEMIEASIAAYSGSCPCPYNRDRAGRSCGRRSAYSRPGGSAPWCYPADISQESVDSYRKKTRQ